MFAKGGDELGCERNGCVILKQQRKTFAELNDKAGLETTREIDFDEADVGAGKTAGWSGAWFGHPDEDARLAADR